MPGTGDYDEDGGDDDKGWVGGKLEVGYRGDDDKEYDDRR